MYITYTIDVSSGGHWAHCNTCKTSVWISRKPTRPGGWVLPGVSRACRDTRFWKYFARFRDRVGRAIPFESLMNYETNGTMCTHARNVTKYSFYSTEMPKPLIFNRFFCFFLFRFKPFPASQFRNKLERNRLGIYIYIYRHK